MKQVLSLLASFVFLQTQTWALSGGPVFPSGSPNLAGNYSGVLTPQETRFNFDGVSPDADTTLLEPLRDTSGKIGVFTVDVPPTGLASGSAIIFFNGAMFTGTIDGVADPDRLTFKGILQLDSSFDIDLGNGNTVTPEAHGEMDCKIHEKPTTPLPGRTDTSLGYAARLTGEANIDSFVFVEITGRPIPITQVRYSVTGFRQDTTPMP